MALRTSRAPMRWQGWMTASSNRRILGAVVLIGSLTVAVKLVSMGRDLYVAARFGTGDDLDAYLVALVVPTFLINVIAGSFNAALVPVYIDTREQEGPEAAQHLLASVTLVSAGVLTIVAVALAVATPALLPLLGIGFGPDKLALAERLTYLFLPTIVLSGVATIWASVLNAGERFALAALAPAAVPIVASGVLFSSNSSGITALAIGFVVGVLVYLILLGWGLRQRGIGLLPRWHGHTPAMRLVLRQYAPMTAGALLFTSATIIDRAMAARLGPGSVSVLDYGEKLSALVLSIGSLALGTAVLPYFSKMVAANDWPGVLRTLKTWSIVVGVGTTLTTLVLVAGARPIIRLLFERGEFDRADTRAVSTVLALSALQIPFYALGMLIVRLISSLKANQILLYGACISFVVNISLNYLFSEWLGVPGIALATSCVYLFSTLFLAVMLTRLLRERMTPCA